MSRPRSITVINGNYQTLSQTYYDYLIKMGYDKKASRSKYNYVCEFLHYLEGRGILEVEEIKAEEIQLYYQYLGGRKNLNDGGLLSEKTRHGQMRNVREFFTMLQREGRIRMNPSSNLKFPYPRERKERKILTRKEVDQLYKVTQTNQERAMLSLAYGCGLRVGELERCNTGEVRLGERILIVPNGKGNKRRVVPMSEGIVKDLSEYYYNERDRLQKRKGDKGRYKAFMLNSRGDRMKRWTYNKVLKELVERVGNEEIKEKETTMHSLRHSIASHLLEQGMAVEQVRMFLGHSQLETTQIYTHVNQSQIDELLK